MSAHAAVFSRLSTISEITGGVYAGHAPQGTSMPYVVFHRVSDTGAPYQLGSCGSWKALYQFNIVATGAVEAYVVSEAIREDMDGLQGITIASIDIKRISLQSERDSSILFDSSQTETFEVQQDYNIFYSRTPTP